MVSSPQGAKVAIRLGSLVPWYIGHSHVWLLETKPSMNLGTNLSSDFPDTSGRIPTEVSTIETGYGMS
jgi:hypothetical protein